MDRLYSPKEASKLLGITVRSIQMLDKDGKIKCLKTAGGRRRIPESEIKRLRGEEIGNKFFIIYARVSSHEQKQKGDLQRQVEYLKKMIPWETEEVKVITDVGSGLNDRRKGLQELMELIREKKVTDIVITDKDRLTRFGFHYLEEFCKSFGVRIHVQNGEENKTLEAELVQDMLSIVTSFSGKLYGLRSSRRKKLLENVKEILQEKKPEENSKLSVSP